MTDEPEAKNITNIYYDCLERILDLLDLKDLLNLAQTCKRLQIAAAAKFGDTYGEYRVELHPRYGFYSSEIYVMTNSVGLYGNIRLPFLRCFGSKVSELGIQFTNEDRQADRVGQYIIEYCVNNLTKISLRGLLTLLNDSFQKPFQTVAEVSIEECKIKLPLGRCLDLFPNMHRLELSHTAIDQTAIQVHFPHLKHLFIVNDAETGLTNEEIAQILHSNKQLESLVVWSFDKMTFSEFSNMISEHPSLSQLTVNLKESTMGNPTKAELLRFTSEHPLLTNLGLWSFYIPVDEVTVFLDQLKSLKKFMCDVKDRSEYDQIVSLCGNSWRHEIFDFDNSLKMTLTRQI